MTGTRPARIIVLAAQRAGIVDPLALRFGCSHKCLVPLQGQPLIAHVLTTLGHHRRVGEIVVSIEPELHAEIAAIAALLRIPVTPLTAADNLADSVLQAAAGYDGPIVVTTADNALLEPESIDAVLDALPQTGAAIAMAGEAAVRAAHAEGQRRFYQFRDGGYSNCNLYAFADRGALRSAEAFRGGGQFAKKASRIVSAFGLLNLLLPRLKLVSLPSAMRRISRRLKVEIVPVILSDGTQAIDVDNDRTYRVVEELMRGKALVADRVLAA